MPLKIWNGSAYTNVKDLRAGASLTPSQYAYVWNGTTFVVVWERPAIYKLTKTGSQTGTGTSYIELTNLLVDAAYPKTRASGNDLIIPPMVPPYTARVQVSIPHTGGSTAFGGARYTQARIVKNGSVIAEGTQSTGDPGTATATVDTECHPSDLFSVQWRGEGALNLRPTAGAGAFLEVAPL